MTLAAQRGNSISAKRTLTVVFAVLTMLFLQVAAAAYACPSPMTMNSGAAAPGGQCEQAGCAQQGMTQPTLCVAAMQTSSEASLVGVQNVLVAITIPRFAGIFSSSDFRVDHIPPPPGLSRPVSASIAVSNCCYRI